MERKPTLVCPNCGRPMEYHVTIEVVEPPIGKIDTGYCAACARLCERIRDTRTYYDSTLWPPLCRQCRQPVSFGAALPSDEEAAVFRCRQHPSEQWVWTGATERWTRRE
jgi:hypothetical protein